jgi:hypothetical protein
VQSVWHVGFYDYSSGSSGFEPLGPLGLGGGVIRHLNAGKRLMLLVSHLPISLVYLATQTFSREIGSLPDHDPTLSLRWLFRPPSSSSLGYIVDCRLSGGSRKIVHARSSMREILFSFSQPILSVRLCSTTVRILSRSGAPVRRSPFHLLAYVLDIGFLRAPSCPAGTQG